MLVFSGGGMVEYIERLVDKSAHECLKLCKKESYKWIWEAN